MRFAYFDAHDPAKASTPHTYDAILRIAGLTGDAWSDINEWYHHGCFVNQSKLLGTRPFSIFYGLDQLLHTSLFHPQMT